jgi:protein-S-isoprenylcysteine O-methyltransferase Ste14
MGYILLGVFGFLCFLFFDYFSLKHYTILKYFCLISGIIVMVYSTFQLVSLNLTVNLPQMVRIVSLIFAIIFLLLTIYSVFIEVGISTYKVQSNSELVTIGTYGLVRHPGVIWLFFMFLFTSIYFESALLFLATIIWSIVNSLYVVIQEKFIFPKIFSNYSNYIQTTPMLIPNKKSIKRIFTTTNWRKE